MEDQDKYTLIQVPAELLPELKIRAIRLKKTLRDMVEDVFKDLLSKDVE